MALSALWTLSSVNAFVCGPANLPLESSPGWIQQIDQDSTEDGIGESLRCDLIASSSLFFFSRIALDKSQALM
jgi:hypothetical protein